MTEQLLYLAAAVFFGLIGGALANKLKLPAVTGYLVAGLILGLFKVIPMESLHGFAVLTDLALGFIAFSIGNELKLSILVKLGRTPLLITVFEAWGAVSVLLLIFFLMGYPLPTILLLSAIGASTAPAATLMIVRQYRADGPVTRTLLPVVAMDNTVALITFSIMAAVAQALVDDTGAGLAGMILNPLLDIFLSLLAGVLIGFVLSLLIRFFDRDPDRLSLVVAAVLLGAGLSAWTQLSALLVCMAAGAAFSNFSSGSLRTFRLVDAFTPPLFLVFLVLSGAELNLNMLRSLGLMGLLYIVGRAVGKVGGSFLGARLGKAEPVVARYLGFTLIPQAGVAIGLSLAAMRLLPEYGEQIRVVVLSSILIYELIGPVISRIALARAGEIPDLDKQATDC